MKVKKLPPPPVEPPPAVVTIELTHEEKLVLQDLLGYNITIPAALRGAGEKNVDAIEKLMYELHRELREL